MSKPIIDIESSILGAQNVGASVIYAVENLHCDLIILYSSTDGRISGAVPRQYNCTIEYIRIQ